jgi:predicted ester cyclase
LSLEENKAIIRKLYEVFNEHNPALLDEIITPDYVDHTLQLRGLEQWKQILTLLLKGFPDLHPTIEGIIAEGDKVWIHVKATGTHTGEYLGLAPTGKKITFRYSSIWRIVNGKVVERETVYDLLDLHKKLGVVEYKGFPEE